MGNQDPSVILKLGFAWLGNWGQDGQMALPQIHIFHIYTRSKFTKPRFTQNPDLHKLKFTQLIFTHTQIYTAPYWPTQIYTTQIYTKPKYINLSIPG